MIKYLKSFCLAFLATLTFACKAQNAATGWNNKIEIQHLKNRQDSSTWDTDLLRRDIESNKERTAKPMKYGAFPVPKYELLGKESFKGVGNGVNFTGIDINEKKLLYSYFLVNKNAFTEKFVGDRPNEVFFIIVTLTDSIDTVNYTHAGVQVISRNNPDYIGQGFFKTKNEEIDYIAFLTASRDEYAIVNMRLFNLKNGRMILIAPQKDGSLRSMQIQTPVLSDIELSNYIDKILQQDDIKKFFGNSGAI